MRNEEERAIPTERKSGSLEERVLAFATRKIQNPMDYLRVRVIWGMSYKEVAYSHHIQRFNCAAPPPISQHPVSP